MITVTMLHWILHLKGSPIKLQYFCFHAYCTKVRVFQCASINHLCKSPCAFKPWPAEVQNPQELWSCPVVCELDWTGLLGILEAKSTPWTLFHSLQTTVWVHCYQEMLLLWREGGQYMSKQRPHESQIAGFPSTTLAGAQNCLHLLAFSSSCYHRLPR